MKITERDIEILKFINEFGFCEMPQIEKNFGIKKPRSYKVMQRLVKAGLVIHKRLFHNRHGIFSLSHRGARYTELPPMMNIPLSTYFHQLTIIEVYFKLMQKYPDANWISERNMKRNKFIDGIGKKGHIADGMLILPDQKKIPIEVELTQKGELRLNKILKGYATNFSIKEVWYYCSLQAINRVKALAVKLPFIKVYSLQDLLNEKN